jgi:hypothetical protein
LPFFSLNVQVVPKEMLRMFNPEEMQVLVPFFGFLLLPRLIFARADCYFGQELWRLGR